MLQFLLFSLLTIQVDTLPRIENIKIYNQVGNVNIVRADTFYVKIHPYPQNDKSFKITQDIRKNTLHIESRAIKSCSNCGVDITVGMPSLNKANIEITSGNLTISGNIQNIKASISSGSIKLNGMFSKVQLESLSGDIECVESEVDTLNISLLKGTVTIKANDIIKKGYINVLSGLVKLSTNDNQGFTAVLTEKKDTIRHKGDGNLSIKVTSGLLKGI